MDQAAPQAAGDPLGQMSEVELLRLGHQAMARAARLPVGSLGRKVQWAVYDTYAGELGRRALAWASTASRPAARELQAMQALSRQLQGRPVTCCAARAGRRTQGAPPGLSPGSGGPS
jgi:hypothetical protein